MKNAVFSFLWQENEFNLFENIQSCRFQQYLLISKCIRICWNNIIVIVLHAIPFCCGSFWLKYISLSSLPSHHDSTWLLWSSSSGPHCCRQHRQHDFHSFIRFLYFDIERQFSFYPLFRRCCSFVNFFLFTPSFMFGLDSISFHRPLFCYIVILARWRHNEVNILGREYV